jgi:NTE family protein
MVTSEQTASSAQEKINPKQAKKKVKVAVACQGGGMHAAFEVGVLTKILEDVAAQKFELVGLSGTSAGALCALMVWYGLAHKNGNPGSAAEASKRLNDLWDDFIAKKGAEKVLNCFTYGTLRAEEMEIPLLGINAPLIAGSFNPYGALYQTVAAWLPHLGVRQEYFDLHELLAEVCPALAANPPTVDWQQIRTRLLIGASEVVNGFETVFDSGVNSQLVPPNQGMQPNNTIGFWRQRLPLSLSGVAASGTLPIFREAEHIDGGDYWDGLYSQNPPIREFFYPEKPDRPQELWIIRINPQQWPHVPKSNTDVQDRENELMGNLSLNKELDFLMLTNHWSQQYGGPFADHHPHVTVRTIKMNKMTADELRYSSKFDRSEGFMNKLRQEGETVARNWLNLWISNQAPQYPADVAW